ncbi:MAG: aromatic ring-hydroxylating dioxygenase subunit alpha [Alphaproteobacteria bacterium]|nr:aromatic ring-hydroxylating dioxygenase subunit alpha [Alphaproteobacteria bacterium]
MAVGKGAKRAYAGYSKNLDKAENAELTHVRKGTPCGEFLRRFWHPIALSDEVRHLPKRARALGEDLVVFRDRRGRLGCLDLHCSHRGTSLEFALVTETGLRCCYHGWLYDVDGTILETPGEPPASRLAASICHGAYPVREHGGLIFGYFGPLDEQPEFFVTDAAAIDGNECHPYFLPFACNWLQVHENSMDPLHSVFLHTRTSGVQFSDAFGVLPVVSYKRTDLGVISTATRRTGELVWVRVNDELTPNIAQFGPPWEDGTREKLFMPPAITRWILPIDDTHCATVGWRHFNAMVDPDHRGRPEEIGRGKVDFMGQQPDRPYEERQIQPGDYDAQVSQRPIAVHALENLGTSDVGITLLRRNVARGVATVKNGKRLEQPKLDSGHVLRTYAHDTVLRLPARSNDDAAFLAATGETVTRITLATASLPRGERRPQAIRQLREAGLC